MTDDCLYLSSRYPVDVYMHHSTHGLPRCSIDNIVKIVRLRMRPHPGVGIEFPSVVALTVRNGGHSARLVPNLEQLTASYRG